MKTLRITIGIALAAATAWFVVSDRTGPRQPDSPAVASPARDSTQVSIKQPATRSSDDPDAARAPVERASAAQRSNSATADSTLREAIDTGRAQPVFLSITAPPRVRAGERF